ncbi:unnamed protein product [Victoria cruziana]
MGERAMNQACSESEASPSGNFCSPILTQEWVDGGTDKFLLMENGFTSASTSGKWKRGFKQISPGVFYGSPLGAPAKNPHQLLRLLNDTDDLRKRNELITRRGNWLTFPRQDDAIKFADSHADVSVFSYQDHFSGQRRFLVSSYEEFWQRYSSMDSKFHHHYEVIQEGLPCHLYFDLEFNRKVNREHNGVHMVDLLVSFIFEAIHDIYGICCKHDWVVELDSSTQEKFSCHLIIRIPDIAFKDNSHVGGFVAEVCSRITCERLKDPRLNQLRQIFMESLICRMDVNCKELLTFDLEAKSNREPASYISEELAACPLTNDMCNQYLSGKSPFPSLDRFIESVVSNSGTRGWIRSWYLFSDYDLMVYNIAGNRFCERIGRQHKSNHVMYVVDFRRSCYYQKCHDPECRGYRSSMHPIPYDVICCSFNSFNEANMKKQTAATDFNIQLDETDEKPFSSIPNTDSIKRDGAWWQEVIQKVDDVESLRKILDFTELDSGKFAENN